MDIRRRADTLEIMDTLECSAEELSAALNFLKTANSFFGGARVILNHLDSALPKIAESFTLLDVGCGLGDIGLKVIEWGRLVGRTARVTALDGSPEVIGLAKENARGREGIEFIAADFLSWECPEDSFDFVTASLVLHHLPENKLLEFVQKCGRIARQGVVFSDLERSRAGYWAVSLASRVLGNRIVRNDGPLSVRRAFKVAELERLAKDAGLPYLKARKEEFFRLSLSGEKN
ncbi:MAG: hypothetical protein A3A86_04070 [Elusimicrobia bacterium RIFCSPLOWO2_01_FULL_60_11]|nr:MAG: hypothetical protein A3A86_04070 [Elusimicrobia bacterium RIFCSPLOWO2_01_FULL_60_11]